MKFLYTDTTLQFAVNDLNFKIRGNYANGRDEKGMHFFLQDG